MSDFFSLKTSLVFFFFVILTAAAGEDLRKRRISNRYPLEIIILGVLSAWAGFAPGLEGRLLGVMAAGFPLFAAAVVCPSSLGGGDVKLAAACGFFLGLPEAVLFLFWMLALAGMAGALLLLSGRAGKGDRLPLGPFFVLRAVLVILL